ncbi:MAG TPA: C69 family dipeptidase, partial [Thermoanaerobaculaceae bacterium]|nr:C69 family dipeptidase [Thermoanaerobaculaceae bacterium]
LGVQDVMALMRDHYEGTPMDMTAGVDAGPFGSPLRSRPMTFQLDGKPFSWERPISTQQTGCSYVANSRSFLPDEVGGVLWYGLDDTYTSCYVPLYAGNTAVPPSFTQGSLKRFSWDSAWWVFNLVANFSQLKFSYMVKDIQKVQQELEGNFFELQPAIEKTAQAMLATDPERARRFLTDYSVSAGEQVTRRWKELAEALFTRYNDGYVQDASGEPQELGYPESWLREVVRARPGQLDLPGDEVIKSPESY